MVDRIEKIASDHIRVEHKQESDQDESEPRSQEEEKQKDESSSFARGEMDAHGLGKEGMGSRSLLTRDPASLRQAFHADPAPSEVDDDTSVSTTLTFLRATGMANQDGSPRWSYISLYTMALVGFVITTFLVLRILV